MNLPRRRFLHLAAGAATLPAVSRFAWAQAYPSRPLKYTTRVEQRSVQLHQLYGGSIFGSAL
jgi:hypothetical protein